MTSIVELREMSEDKIEELIENAREEMFNLRFQQASAQLENYTRMRTVRREIAKLQTVLHMRNKAIATAAQHPDITAVLAGKEWDAVAQFSYEDSAYRVEFADEDGNDLAEVMVDLNKKQPKGRRQRALKSAPELVIGYEILG